MRRINMNRLLNKNEELILFYLKGDSVDEYGVQEEHSSIATMVKCTVSEYKGRTFDSTSLLNESTLIYKVYIRNLEYSDIDFYGSEFVWNGERFIVHGCKYKNDRVSSHMILEATKKRGVV